MAQELTLYQERVLTLARLHGSDAFDKFIAALEARKEEIDANWHTYRGENLMAALGGKTEIDRLLKDIRSAVTTFTEPQQPEEGRLPNASVY